MAGKEKWLVVVFTALLLLMVSIVLINGLLGGIIYDTDHFGDTLFMLGAAWRAHEGLIPAIDFGHFYGGALAQGLGMTMRVVGPGVIAFDYFTLLLTAILIGLSAIVLSRRMSTAGLAALFLLITTLMLTRFPLENGEAILRVVSTHSFLYNRFGLAVVVIAGLFTAFRSDTGRDDLIGGMVVGLLAGLLLLVKPTFIILAPGIGLGLLLQRRWQALVGFLAGMAVVVLLMDPVLTRWKAALSYGMAHVGGQEGTQVKDLLRKAVQVPMAQPVALVMGGAATGYLLLKHRDITPILTMLIVAVSGVGMTTTMGGNGNLGQLALPIVAMIALGAAEISTRAELHQTTVLRAFAFCIVAALAIPHAANLLAATAEGYRNRDRVLIEQGPYARYLSQPEENSAGPQYQMLADGIKALSGMGDASQWGIIATQGISFEHALLARPVPGYPLWQRATAPELAEGVPLDPAVDIVMLSRADGDGMNEVLSGKMGEDFVLCTASSYWDIYARKGNNIPSCPHGTPD